MWCSVLLCLLWSLMMVYSQTFPYISFMGETLPNHAYVDLSLVGNDASGSDSIQCHTDLDSCCNRAHGDYRGDWIPPGSEARLPFSYEEGDIYELRGAQRVDLRRRNNADTPSGIYHCSIAVLGGNDTITVKDSVYVVLYMNTSGGELNTTYYNIITSIQAKMM